MSKILTFGSDSESVVSDPSVCFTCKIIKNFQFFRIFIISPGLSMNSDTVLIRIDPHLLHAHILTLEALGGIFFSVDLKFSVQIALSSTQNFLRRERGSSRGGLTIAVFTYK